MQIPPSNNSWSKVRDFGRAQYVICTLKLDEENPKYADLAQENGFGSA
jgi:hypothetical protein